MFNSPLGLLGLYGRKWLNPRHVAVGKAPVALGSLASDLIRFFSRYVKE